MERILVTKRGRFTVRPYCAADEESVLAIGWASGCREPYRILARELEPTGDFDFDMQSVCEGIEEAVNKGPSCWGGWLYLDEMAV